VEVAVEVVVGRGVEAVVVETVTENNENTWKSEDEDVFLFVGFLAAHQLKWAISAAGTISYCKINSLI
jgi:hypothetical protein